MPGKVNALDKKASSALSHYIMAVMQEDLGNVDNAIEEYKKASKYDFEAVIIHLRLTSGYIKNNQLDKAAKELQQVISLEPSLAEPHAILALLYSSQNRLDEATREYELALKNAVGLKPQMAALYKSLGLIYLQQKRNKEAKDTFELILNLSPGDHEAHFYLGHIHDQSGDRKKAEEELKKSLELKPDFGEALNYLGYLYLEENKNIDQANSMIKKAVETDPNNGAFIDSLGWLYFKQGKTKDAVRELERATTLIDDPVIYEHLGDAYFKLNDESKAKSNWEKSLELEPAQGNIKKKLKQLTI